MAPGSPGQPRVDLEGPSGLLLLVLVTWYLSPAAGRGCFVGFRMKRVMPMGPCPPEALTN